MGLWVATACGRGHGSQEPTPQPTLPLPTAGIAGQKVPLFPLPLVGAEDTLHWDALVADRRATLDRADSVIDALLAARAPEVSWVTPGELRRIARRAVGVAADPDQMGTAFLRAEKLVDVPDPLRSELRMLAGLAGGRYVLVPAGLVYRRSGGQAVSRSDSPPDRPTARPPLAIAELSVVLVDTRLGKVGWRTVARGEGGDPWTALTRAMKSLTPGLP